VVEMTDRPIIMSGPMVRALLDGKKSQTRRLAWKRVQRDKMPVLAVQQVVEGGQSYWVVPTFWQKARPGDRLWVRETHTFETCREIGWHEPPFNDGRPLRVTDDPDWGKFWDQPHYRATDPTPDLAYDDLDEAACRWRPSIHMPRWASRTTLVVTETRMERLQDVDVDAAKAEGVWSRAAVDRLCDEAGLDALECNPIEAFAMIWRDLHGPGAWEANPEVVALTFAVHQCNIDQMGEAA